MSKNIKMKPGKVPSGMGMVIGIVFCMLGLVVAIPNFGAFGVFWTICALVITVQHAVNLFSEKGVTTHEIIIEDDDTNHSNEKKDIESRLQMIESLYVEGKITKEEYDKKRQSILDEI